MCRGGEGGLLKTPFTARVEARKAIQGSLQQTLFCPLTPLCYVACGKLETSPGRKVQLVNLSVALRKKLRLAEGRTRVAFLLVADSFRIQKESLGWTR